MSNSQSRAACGPVQGFVRPSLGFRCSKIILQLTTYLFFDSLDIDIFDADGLQYHFVTSATFPVRIQTLSVH